MKRPILSFLIAAAVAVTATTAWAEAPRRVVSIGGAVTEIIYALGAEKLLAGCDTTSYFPKAAEKLPKIGYMRALSAEGILSLRPDLVLMTDEAGPPAVIEQLRAAGLNMIIVAPGRTLDGVRENIRTVAEALGREAQAADILTALARDEAALVAAVDAMESHPKVMFILQHGGGAPMVAGTGTAADSIIRLAGGKNAVTGYRGYKPLTPESAVVLQPDAMLITDQGLKQAGGKDGLMAAPGVALTPAAQAGRIHAMDSLLLLGFGPRTATAALDLNRMLRAE